MATQIFLFLSLLVLCNEDTSLEFWGHLTLCISLLFVYNHDIFENKSRFVSMNLVL
jgi:hypothetical protein